MFCDIGWCKHGLRWLSKAKCSLVLKKPLHSHLKRNEHRDKCIYKEWANKKQALTKHACTAPFCLGLTLAEGPKLECCKSTTNNIFISNLKIL